MPEFQTHKVVDFASSGAAMSVDFEATGQLGPADAVMIHIKGADRDVQLEPHSGVAVNLEIQDGFSPVFDHRTTKVTVMAGDAAEVQIVAFYTDRWQ